MTAAVAESPAERNAPFTVKLGVFEGPLDLLYYLIRKHELEISTIALADVADEFTAAVEAAENPDLAHHGAYLVIAATLMYLKSKYLLPPDEESPDQALEEQAGTLLQRLVDMQKLREVVHELSLKEDRARASFPRPLTTEMERRLDVLAEREPFIEMSVFELLKSMRKLQDFAFPVIRAVAKEEIRLEDKIAEVLAVVRFRIRVSISRLMRGSRSLLEAVVCFMAALELTKQRAIRLEQKETFGEIEAVARTLPSEP